VTDKPDTVLGVLAAAEGYLARRGVDAPRRSVELLMGRVLGLDRLALYLAHDRPLSESELARMRELVVRRARHEPLAYLLGDHEFHGHLLEVTPDVLIPRPETEGLVDLAIAAAPSGARCVDLGTGSGAIAIALALARTDVSVVAVDASREALAVAQRNVARHGLSARVRLVHGSYWEPLAGEAPFDLLVGNPPYVDPSRRELVADDVARYEPGVALWTPPGRPAAAYEAIVGGLVGRLAPGAPVLLETGVGAAEPALDVLRASPFLVDVDLRPDLAGSPRYLVARVATA
jgi:release factor glutamine methyltransferase